MVANGEEARTGTKTLRTSTPSSTLEAPQDGCHHFGPAHASRDSKDAEKLVSNDLCDDLRRSVTNITNTSDSSLVRAVPLGVVTARLGAVFKSSIGTASGFMKSREVAYIDDFLSHNWSCGRWTKFAALALYYNTNMAICAMYLTGIVASVLTACGKLPHFTVSRHFNPSGMCSFNSLDLGYAAFLFVLCFGDKIRQLLCMRQPLVFLDKLCIDQSDPVRKLEGIRSLATFLCRSRSMVVLYSSQYLRRLWTVYEVASFLTLHRDHSRIHISPDYFTLQLAAFVPLLILEVKTMDLLGIFVDVKHDMTFPVGRFLFLSLNALVSCFAVRCWCRKAHEMRSAAGEFAVRDATCSDESDRELVQTNISLFMKYLGKVPVEASQDEALDAFDDVVRMQMPLAMESSLGPNLLKCRFVIALTAGYTLTGLDEAALILLAGLPWTQALFWVMSGALINFALAPVGQWAMAKALSSDFHLRGLSEICYVMRRGALFVWPLLFVMELPQIAGLEPLSREKPDLACLLLTVYVLFLIPVVVFLFRPKKPTEDGSLETPLDNELEVKVDSCTHLKVDTGSKADGSVATRSTTISVSEERGPPREATLRGSKPAEGWDELPQQCRIRASL